GEWGACLRVDGERLELGGEGVSFFRRGLGRAGSEKLVTSVEENDALGQRCNKVDARIKRPGKCALGLADTNASEPSGDDDDAKCEEQGSPRQQSQSQTRAPADHGWGGRRCSHACQRSPAPPLPL